MLVQSVACIDDWNVEMAREDVRRSRRWVTHHDEVSAERAQCVSGIEQRFAFLDAGSCRGDNRSSSAERLSCKFEGDASAGGRFVKEERDAVIAKQRPGPSG